MAEKGVFSNSRGNTGSIGRFDLLTLDRNFVPNSDHRFSAFGDAAAYPLASCEIATPVL
jgi:hypothetical protein